MGDAVATATVFAVGLAVIREDEAQARPPLPQRGE